MGSAATLIGDVVGSRRTRDRIDLHARLEQVITAVNEMLNPVAPLRITVGDEYQGAFHTVAQAVRATTRIRLAMLPDYDVRHGLGWGEVTVLRSDPRVEDGPGWWSARDAIHAVEEAAERAPSRWRRTAYRSAADTGPDQAWIESTLVLADALLGALTDRSVAVLDGLLTGRTQREIAASLGITPSAVSQRVRADGLDALVTVDRLLDRAPGSSG